MNEVPGTAVLKGSSRVNILDESVRSGPARNYRLLFSLDSSFLGLAVAEPSEQKFAGLEAFHFPKPLASEQLAEKITSLSSHSEILKHTDFRSVSVQVCNRQFTFVPKALFREDDASSYLQFNQPEQTEECFVRHDVIHGFEAVNIFAFPVSIAAALKTLFENYQVHHHCSALLESARILSGNSTEKTLFLNVHSEMLNVIVTEGRKLLLCNAFPFHHVEDAGYFVLFVCEQLGLNPEQIRTVLSGEVERNSALGNLLFRYIKHIKFSDRLSHLKFTYGFDELPRHYYHSVYSQILCES